MMLPYSKFDLTKLVNKVLSMSIYSKDGLISPKIPFAVLDTQSICVQLIIYVHS